MRRTLVASAVAIGCASAQPVTAPSTVVVPAATRGAAPRMTPSVPPREDPAPPRVPEPAPDRVDVTILAPGAGSLAKAGDQLLVNYTGTLVDGTVFDSTRGRRPFQFTLGGGQVIKGWEQGLDGMQVGEQRRIVIPWTLAYGERGMPPKIPPRSTLVFDVELVAIMPP